MQPTPVDRNTAVKSTYAIIATFGCIACTLFLIAATIVLALIPIYTSQKEVTVDQNGRQSKLADLTVAIDNSTTNTTAATGRRRRSALGNETAYENATVSDSSLSDLKSKFFPYIQNHVKDLVIVSASIIPKTNTLTRRESESKRDDSGVLALRIFFYVIFKDDCSRKCQLLKAAAAKSAFQNVNFQNVIIPNFIVTLKEGQRMILNLRLGSKKKVSDILLNNNLVTPDYGGDDYSATDASAVTSNLSG